MSYILESAFCLACLYVLYWLLLRRETFFQWNRVYLVLAPLAACLIPALRIRLEHPVSAAPAPLRAVPAMPVRSLPVLVEQVQAAPQAVEKALEAPLWSFTVGELLCWCYSAVALALIAQLVWQLYRLLAFIRRCRRWGKAGATLLQSVEPAPLASFFGFVFWHPGVSDDAEQQLMFEHEMVHVRQWHSLDLILMELLIAVQWFNPLLYLYRRSLRAVHEYIADDYVVRRTRQRYAYARLLANRQTTGNGAQPGLVNTFHSLTQHRLVMLAKHPSSPVRRAKYLLALPLFAALLLLFSFRLVERFPELRKTAATLDNYTARLAGATITAPQDDARESNYIFYWGQFQCRLMYDAAKDGYNAVVHLSADDFRASVTQAPYLWDGKSLHRACSFDLGDRRIEPVFTMEEYAEQWQKMTVWAQTVKAGEHFLIHNFALPDGKQARIELLLDAPAPEPDPLGFIWGKDIWLAAAGKNYVGLSECLRLLKNLPRYAEKPYQEGPARYGRLEVHHAGTGIRGFYFYPGDGGASGDFYREMAAADTWLQPGDRLVFEDIEGDIPQRTPMQPGEPASGSPDKDTPGLQKVATMEVVADNDPRLGAPQGLYSFAWGKVQLPLGPDPNVQWIMGNNYSPHPHATFFVVSKDFTADEIIGFLNEKPKLIQGQSEIPLRSMRIEYEGLKMGYRYEADKGFPAPLVSMLREHLKAGERITLSFIESERENFAHVSIDLVAKAPDAPVPFRMDKPIGLRLMPNPASDRTTLEIELPEAGPGALTITDPGGVLCYSLKTDFHAGVTPLQIPFFQVKSKGVYMIRLEMPYGSGSTKLVVE